MKPNNLSNQQQVEIRSMMHRRPWGSRLAGIITISLVFLTLLAGAGSLAGAREFAPDDLAAVTDPILPFGDPIIVEHDTGGEAVMGKPGVAGDGTNFLVVWRADDKDIRGARLAHDGTLLDPDGIDILVSPETSGFPAVGFDGTNFVVFFSHIPSGESIWELYAVRVAPDGTVLDPQGVRITNTTIGLRSYRMLGVAFDGTNYIVAWRSDISDVYTTRVSQSLVNLDGPAGSLVSGNHGSWYPAVAFDGTNFLVTWHDGRNSPHDIYGARVTTAGVVLDPGGFLIASGPGDMNHNGVAFDGTNYLVVWMDHRPNPMPDAVWVYGTRVTPAGVVLDNPPILIADDHWEGVVPVAVASDGDGFMVVWTSITMASIDHGIDFRLSDVLAREVSSDGVVLGDTPIPIGVAHWHQAAPTIGFDTDRFLVSFGHTQNKAAVRLLSRQAPPAPPTGSVGGPSSGGWAAETSPVADGYYADVHALASDQAYAVGGVPFPVSTSHIAKRVPSGWSLAYEPYNQPYGIWAAAADDIWSTGKCGSLFHYEGAAWGQVDGCYLNNYPDTRIAENIWTDGEGTVMAAANQGLLMELNSNGNWQTSAQPVTNDLWDIWGSWRDDVWAVGANATILHYNGQSWTRVAGVPTIQSINGVSGSSSENVYAVGDFGAILHWDGSSWSAQASGTLKHLMDVWAVSDDEAYAVGLGGMILHLKSGVWTQEISGTTNAILGVSGVRDPVSGVMAVWAVGDDVLLHTESPLVGNPVGMPDRYEVEKDEVLSINAAAGVLANDYDPEGNSLTAAETEPPRLGTLGLNADGSFVYTPDPDTIGIDAFWYEVSDGNGGSDTVRVVVEITPGPEPIAVDDGPYYSEQGGAKVVAPGVLDNDWDPNGDSLTAVLVDDPMHGSVTLRSDGTFDYTHDGSATTSDSFTYKAFDGSFFSDLAVVRWIIGGTQPDVGQWIYNPATGNYYAFNDAFTFVEAEAQAQKWGGHLVSIDNQAEQDWLYINFGFGSWIGMNDLTTEGTWEWTSGATVVYTNWCQGEPNDAGEAEDAANLSRGNSGVDLCWNDVPIDGIIRGIVERSMEGSMHIFLPVLLESP